MAFMDTFCCNGRRSFSPKLKVYIFQRQTSKGHNYSHPNFFTSIMKTHYGSYFKKLLTYKMNVD